MRPVRLTHLLLGLALLAWTGVNAALTKCEENCQIQQQKGFYRERPKCECGTGYYKSCFPGSYYAHTPTMCIYVSRQVFTHEEAEQFCAKRFESSGFLAFVEDWDESYHISHYVWNDLKNGVEGNETHFWTSGKFSRSRNQTFWLYEYGGNYHAEIPDALFPTNDSTRKDAESSGRHCIAGHTEHYDQLHAKNCSEKLPAVCYYYRETIKWYCPVVHGMVATLFRRKCYYRHSAPRIEDHKTWFESREECAKLGAKLASVHDNATQEKLLQLSAGKETITNLQESTWVGLQRGKPGSGCWWHADERPLLKDNDPNPEKGVDRCNTTYSNSFPGEWEDGRLYSVTESAQFWASDEPNEATLSGGCDQIPDEQTRAYCERGPGGKLELKPDLIEHCAQMFPADEKRLTEGLRKYAGKWNDYWCYKRNRGYVCERPALRSTIYHDEL
ncbi:macrophage mannose receptor 1 [Aphelenchoides avenae]|nr:macrophage mannose receptor 1 [Aphelenchus avenae]